MKRPDFINEMLNATLKDEQFLKLYKSTEESGFTKNNPKRVQAALYYSMGMYRSSGGEITE